MASHVDVTTEVNKKCPLDLSDLLETLCTLNDIIMNKHWRGFKGSCVKMDNLAYLKCLPIV